MRATDQISSHNATLLEEYIRLVDPLITEGGPVPILSGSLALYLRDIISRDCHDIDIVGPTKEFFLPLLDLHDTDDEGYEQGEDSNWHLRVTSAGSVVDLFISTEESGIYEFKGHRLRLARPEPIMEAKFRYFNRYGGLKHASDLRAYIDFKTCKTVGYDGVTLF